MRELDDRRRRRSRDMAATGASPTYFNYDNFEEIQIATAGQRYQAADRRPGRQSGRQARNQSVSAGWRRGYFDNDTLDRHRTCRQSSRCKASRRRRRTITSRSPTTASSVGGPILKDKAWFYGSYSIQDIRLVRQAGSLIDRTQLKDPDVKLNWQATQKDMISFLHFDGVQDQRRPESGHDRITLRRAVRHVSSGQRVLSFPLHGLWKMADDRCDHAQPVLVGQVRVLTTPGSLLDAGGAASISRRDGISRRHSRSARRVRA